MRYLALSLFHYQDAHHHHNENWRHRLRANASGFFVQTKAFAVQQYVYNDDIELQHAFFSTHKGLYQTESYIEQFPGTHPRQTIQRGLAAVSNKDEPPLAHIVFIPHTITKAERTYGAAFRALSSNGIELLDEKMFLFEANQTTAIKNADLKHIVLHCTPVLSSPSFAKALDIDVATLNRRKNYFACMFKSFLTEALL